MLEWTLKSGDPAFLILGADRVVAVGIQSQPVAEAGIGRGLLFRYALQVCQSPHFIPSITILDFIKMLMYKEYSHWCLYIVQFAKRHDRLAGVKEYAQPLLGKIITKGESQDDQPGEQASDPQVLRNI